jgi:hypothetical protein
MTALTLFELPAPIQTAYAEEVCFVRLLYCHKCFSTRLYKPMNSPAENADYRLAGLFLLFCQNCATYQNHAGAEDSYRGLAEMRASMGRRYHGW